MRKRTSPIWKMEKERLIDIVKQSTTITEVLKHFKITNKGNNYKTLYARFKEDNIDYSHIKLGKGFNKGRKFTNAHKIPLSKILIENSTYNRNNLKRRLIQNGMLKNECYECKLGTEWNGKKLSLQIDHINGIFNDNRLNNLRILCPNCHSQTNTFAGRKLKKATNVSNKPREYKRKVERPSKEKLEKLLWEIPTTKLAKQFGVSDKAIEKWAKAYGINKPARGHWTMTKEYDDIKEHNGNEKEK